MIETTARRSLNFQYESAIRNRTPTFLRLGCYPLPAARISTENLPAELSKKLPCYPQLPVTLLGRLAVVQIQKGEGLGQFLLMDALRRILSTDAEIAAMAVVVEAKDDEAEAFYRHFDFRALQKQPRRILLPVKIVARLFTS